MTRSIALIQNITYNIQMMSISITTDPYLEAKYLCFIAKSIQRDKFTNDSYLVLPYPVHGHAKAVYFPHLNYSTSFWKLINKLEDYSLTQPYPQALVSHAQQLIKQSSPPQSTPPKFSHNQNHQSFLDSLALVFSPNILSQFDTCTVLITPYGTRSSFSKIKTATNKYQLICTSRQDFPLANLYVSIIKGIISCLQPGFTDLGTLGYYQRDAIINFLQQSSILKPYLEYPSTTKITDQLLRDSHRYLKILGFPGKHTSFELENFIQTLSPLETNLFMRLWTSTGRLITFDEAAEATWTQNHIEKFSPYALAKLVESLRSKLIAFGIQRPMIHTLRKQGYLLIQ